jgi:hypothetical protein
MVRHAFIRDEPGRSTARLATSQYTGDSDALIALTVTRESGH